MFSIAEANVAGNTVSVKIKKHYLHQFEKGKKNYTSYYN